MRFAGRERIRFFVLAGVIMVLGLGSLVYILLQQRIGNPLVDTYTVTAELPEADGVVGGLGQPVNVAGVRVGSVTDSALVDDVALVTMEIEKDLLPAVHEGASVQLEPITPLEDMQIDLDPGDPSAPELADGEGIPLANNSSPVPLSNVLATLDADTRSYLKALIDAVGGGTKGRGADIRAALRAMGPTTRQVGRITSAIDARRKELARLVTNLAELAKAATRDEELASLVAAGNSTLAAIASEDQALDASLEKLSGTLETTRSTLTNAGEFSRRLGPALRAVRPGVERLPKTMSALAPFVREAADSLASDVRPLIGELQPLARDLAPPLQSLKGASPDLWDSLQALQFTMNVLAYNPPGRDEGGLFWADWFAHNANSAFGAIGDAHGRSARSMILANCQQWAGIDGDLSTLLMVASGVSTICPITRSPDDIPRP